MSREWKPGDVALVRFAWGMGEYYTCLRQERNDRLGWAYSKRGRSDWTADDHPAGPTDIRPLAVIDPEDAEQVERLVEHYRTHWGKAEKVADALQAALREFADPKPPKPEEPTGLGAVVEDEGGQTFVRVARTDNEWPWSGYLRNRVTWAEVNAVRVLSDGVQPEVQP